MTDEAKPTEKSTLVEALVKVYQALDGLSDGERKRVLRATRIMFGHEEQEPRK